MVYKDSERPVLIGFCWIDLAGYDVFRDDRDVNDDRGGMCI